MREYSPAWVNFSFGWNRITHASNCSTHHCAPCKIRALVNKHNLSSSTQVCKAKCTWLVHLIPCIRRKGLGWSALITLSPLHVYTYARKLIQLLRCIEQTNGAISLHFNSSVRIALFWKSRWDLISYIEFKWPSSLFPCQSSITVFH